MVSYSHEGHPLFVDLTQGPLFRASVQNIYRWEQDGESFFVAEATDAGSVFDYGTFFEIPGSGRSRTELRHAVFQRLASANQWKQLDHQDLADHLSGDDLKRLWDGDLLDQLRNRGASTHHIGLIDPETHLVTSDPIESNVVLIREFPVIRPVHFSFGGKPAWDYHAYQAANTKLLAIEHIFRLGSPAGSSIEQRYRAASAVGDSRRILAATGLDRPIVPWGRFSHMIYDCSTKYEDHDRYVEWQEAVHISGVAHEQFESVIDLLSLCTIMVSRLFSSLGFILWDIKWEAAVDSDDIVVVDTVDHDSIRITSDTILDGRHCFAHFNKQAIRDYYRILHPDWLAAIVDAKARSESDPFARPFREILDVGVASGIYPDCPALDPVFARIQSEKYNAVSSGIACEGLVDQNLIRGLVEREAAYYEGRGYLDRYLAEISVPADSAACA